MKNKSLKILFSSFLIVGMLFFSFNSAFAAAATSDSKGHWAESQISDWIDKGFLKGYEDGSIKPDQAITRAEFITLINRSFGYNEEATISFSDISSNNWAYTEVAKAVKAGYIIGYEDETIRASKQISRQEIAVIVSRLLNLSETASAGTSFQDDSLIAAWAKDAVDTIVASEIMIGYEADNSFKPTKSATRAEAIVTLDRAIVFNDASETVPTEPTEPTTPTTPTEPTVPTNLVANSGNTETKLTWSSVAGATYYNVYQMQDNETYELISTSATAIYDVTGLTNGTTYYFKISAANTEGESAYSNAVSATPLSLVTTASVDLGTAGNYVILTKTGVSNVPTSAITGDIGVSPIAAVAITGFDLVADASNQFSTSPQVTGKVYAADYAVPTPNNLTTAINNMETAYTDAAGRAADYTELYSGDISGQTLTAGVYKWGTNVLINTDVTLDGDANDVWIFQISKGITQANGTKINLTGGAQAKNIFWQAADTVSIGTGAHFEGIVLGQKNITLATGARINGRLFAQTGVTLDQNIVTKP